MRELELLKEIKAVALIDDVVQEVAKSHAVVRNLFLSLGTKVAPVVALLDNAEEIKALIDAEVSKIFSMAGQEDNP